MSVLLQDTHEDDLAMQVPKQTCNHKGIREFLNTLPLSSGCLCFENPLNAACLCRRSGVEDTRARRLHFPVAGIKAKASRRLKSKKLSAPMAGVDVEHYTVKDQRCGQEEYRNVKLVLKPDFTAQHVDCTTGCAGGFGTTKQGTYTVNQEKGIVVVKFTKSQYDHSDTSKNEEKDIDECEEYSLETLGIK